MQVKARGIVLKDINIGEADRVITILTEEYGIVRAFAKGSRRIGGRLFASTQILSYANFVLYKGKDKYIVTEAERIPDRSFFDLRQDIERLSLTQYISELAILLAPHEEEASDFLRLVLNTFAALSDKSRDIIQIKAAAELRFMSISGFCPDINGCSVCGNAEENMLYRFYPSEGCLICDECRNAPEGIEVNRGIADAMRYIITMPVKKIFSFRLSKDSLKTLRDICEKYLLCCTERSFKTLDFFNSLFL